MKAIDPRRGAFDILRRVEEGAYADLALDGFLSRAPAMDPRDRALLTELVYGVLRQRSRLDYALARFCRKPLARVEEGVLRLLRLGAYQLLCLERIPARAAVHETVDLARRLGLSRATGFINGILRTLAREKERICWPDPHTDPLACLEHALSLPGWLARRWLAELGPSESLALGEALAGQAPFSLRVNTLKTTRGEYLAALAHGGFAALPTRYAPEGVVITRRGEGRLPGDEAGWYQVQDEASMLIAHLLAPRPGEHLLDACAAPGGKTTHMAALALNQARITALDLHPARVKLIDSGARRLGCRGIEARAWDLTFPPAFLAPASFDRILVDAPCSGLGVLRRNPEIRWRRTPEDLPALAHLQETILGHVAPLLRPGGVLLYSVCTVTPEETDGVVEAFLAAHPGFSREDLRQTVPEGWRELTAPDGSLRTWPHRHGGLDAFFAVRLRRRD